MSRLCALKKWRIYKSPIHWRATDPRRPWTVLKLDDDGIYRHVESRRTWAEAWAVVVLWEDW
jgi:hypothetical protein